MVSTVLSHHATDGLVANTLLSNSLSRSTILMPFRLSWPLAQALQAVSQIAVAKAAELRLVLVLSSLEDAEDDAGEERYAVLRGLHAQLQTLPIPFAIETAVGSLVETAVGRAKDYKASLIVVADPAEERAMSNNVAKRLQRQAPCETLVLSA